MQIADILPIKVQYKYTRPQTLKKQDPNGLYIENDIIQMNIMTLIVEDGASLFLE